MTRSTQLHLIRTRRAVILTVKSAILYAYWQGRTAILPAASITVAMFGIVIAGHAASSHVPALYLVAGLFVVSGLYMFPGKTSKR